MKITQLTIENIKRISAVDIKPDGTLVEITGRNAQGKTTALDSIAYTLGGKKAAPDDPIRQGQNSAKVMVRLDNYIVERTWKRLDMEPCAPR